MPRRDHSADVEWDPEEFIEAVARLGDPTTAEVVVEVGCDGRAGRIHLQDLYEEGRLQREVVGFATKWSLPP